MISDIDDLFSSQFCTIECIFNYSSLRINNQFNSVKYERKTNNIYIIIYRGI
jgi:hypothetical protein